MFFSFFPNLQYDEAFLKDLSFRLQSLEVDNPRYLYDEYVVQNGERPDALSNRFYDVPYYHWVLLVTNNLTLSTWPKSEKRFDEYIRDKYQGTEYETCTWLDSEGHPVPYSFPIYLKDENGVTQNYWFNGDGLGVVQDDQVYSIGGSSKTFLEVEKELNDSRSRIRVLDRSFLGDITDLASSLLKRVQ